MNIKPKIVYTNNYDNSEFGAYYYDYSPVTDYLNKVSAFIEFRWEEISKGVFMIRYKNKIYTYWPKTGKWRARGSKPIYKSKNMHQFLVKYVFKDVYKNELPAFDEI